MRRDRISNLATARTLYTGETYLQARSALCPGQPPLPPASSREQREFEAEVFDQLLTSRQDFTRYSFGIRRVRPEAAAVTLEVESERRAQEILSRMLPSYEPDGDVYGMAGLRIRQRTARGLELHQLGRATSVWLTGLPQLVWDRVELEILETITATEIGFVPVWRHRAAWTREELLHEQQWNTGDWTRRSNAGAWLASGMLRRLALFHSVTPTVLVGGYRGLGSVGYEGFGPVRWVLDLDYRRGVPERREELTAALMDAEFGLPLAPARHLDKFFDHPMPYLLRFDDAERTGLLELRFSSCSYPTLKGEPRYAEMNQAIQQRVATVTERSLPFRTDPTKARPS